MRVDNQTLEYDVAISFAGADRGYARNLADALRNRGITVFYDVYEKGELWGKDLYQELFDVYKKKARYCVIVISQSYARRVWPKHELRSAQDRQLAQAGREYILPVRLDGTHLPGLHSTTGYIDGNTTSVESVAEMISEKLGFVDLLRRCPAEDDWSLVYYAVTSGLSTIPTATVRIQITIIP